MKKLLFLALVLPFMVLSAQAQRTVTGKVTDPTGAPLSDITVQAKGTQAATKTNGEGFFSLAVPAGVKTLVFSSVNMLEQQVALTGQTVVNLTMQPNVSSFDAVVVTVPYGTVKKTAFTGSENTITAATLQKQQVTNVTRALEGLVPGIIATNGGGAPGSGASVLIRGVGSVNASSSPLYVLNGVPYDGSISAIASEDIEAVTVLKDAAAAALYGSRAANGVIMITTKKGKKGRAATNVTIRQGVMTRGIPEYDRVNTQQYYELFWESYRNSFLAQGQTPAAAGVSASNLVASANGLVYNAYNVPAAQLIDPASGKLNGAAQQLWNEPWEKYLFRNANRTNVNINLSGASDKTNYYLSAGYLNEDGIAKFSGYRRYNMRLNLDAAATDWMTVGVNMDGAVANRDDVPSGGTATTNPFYYSRQMGPIYPVYQHNLTNGQIVMDPVTGKPMLDWGVPEQMGTRPYAGRSNLLGSLDLDDRSSVILNGNMNAYSEIKFLKHFALKNTIGINLYNSNSTSYQNNQYGDAAPTPGLNDGGRSTKSFDRSLSLTANQVLSWTRSFDKHNVRALAGHENYLYRYSYVSANSSGFTFPGQTEIVNGTRPFGNPTSNTDNHRIESYFANVNYDFDQTYLLSGSFRTDGSSRFRDAVRWGQFYSVGAGVRLTEMNFMKGISWLNELKLKASYGEQGNESIGLYYPYVNWYYASGTGTYIPPSRPANENLLWETNKTANIGVDFEMFKRRLQGTIEVFNKQSDNLLFDVPLPISTGYGSVWQNIGSMRNYGIELQLGYTVVNKKNFSWRADLNLTSFKNEITKLPPNQREKGIVSGTKKLMEGRGIFDFWLREFAGVDASNGDALYYKDVLGTDGKPTGERVLTNVYNNATYYFFGSSLPKFSGGLTNSLRMGKFDLSFLTVFSYGGSFYDGNYAGIMHRGNPGTHWHADITKRWQNPGDVTVVPRLQNAIAGQDGTSTRFLMDGSYLNLKNVTLSYTMPRLTADRLFLTGAQIFVNVDNAFLLTAKKGMDPQRSFGGTSDASYTPFRTFTVGANLSLK